MSRKHTCGPQRQRLLHGLMAVAHRGHHLQIGPQPRQVGAQGGGEQRFVFGDQRSRHGAFNGSVKVASVPPPAAGPICSRAAAPYSAASRSRTWARPKPSRGVRRPAEAAVAHGEQQPRAIACGAELDVPALDLGLQAMADGVFHQRLQQQRRHRQRGQLRWKPQLRVQARPHAHGHQRQVVVEPRELVGQRVRAGARGRQRGAQEGDQPVEHGLRARRVQRDQHAQVGQRVEQHVRLELRLQQPQLGLARLPRQQLAAAALVEKGDEDHADGQRAEQDAGEAIGVETQQLPGRAPDIGIADRRCRARSRRRCRRRAAARAAADAPASGSAAARATGSGRHRRTTRSAC